MYFLFSHVKFDFFLEREKKIVSEIAITIIDSTKKFDVFCYYYMKLSGFLFSLPESLMLH